MANDRNRSLLRGEGKDEAAGAEERHRPRISKRRKEEDSSDGDSTDDQECGGSRKKRKRGKHRGSRQSSRRARGSSSEGERGEDSSSSASSYSYGDSSEEDSSTGDSASEESEGEVRRRRMRERRKEREHEKERRRKEKERRRKEREHEKERRRKEKEKEKRRKRKKEKTKRKKEKTNRKTEQKEKDLGKKGAVTNSWGKYGVIRETDMWNKRPEFTAWLAEVKKANLESLANWEEKQMFKEFMEDHNTATFPSKKYYNLDAYHQHMMTKEMKKGTKKATEVERTVFNDEEIRRQELMKERERQRDEQVEALKRSMQSGMAQAMKEQAQLKEEMAFQYKLGNLEAAAAIQRRLDPDVAM